MNCKQGDLAIVVFATTTPELIGRIVKVIRPAVEGEPNLLGGKLVFTIPGPAWACESEGSLLPVRTFGGELKFVKQRAIGDCLLRPIRPSESEDEILRIAGKPRELETL